MIYEFYSGSYAAANEEGIIKFALDSEKGTITRLNAFSGISNPSYIAFNEDKTAMYAVQEDAPEGALHGLKVGEDGSLKEAACISSKGMHPCYVSIDAAQKHIFVANYSSGSLAVYSVGEDAMPKELVQLMVHEGSSVHPIRQTAPYVHFAKEHEGKVYVVDLGTDKISVCNDDPAKETIEDTGTYLKLPGGAGPRHMAFNDGVKGVIYVSCEVSSHIAVWKEEAGEYVLKQYISTLPEDFEGENTVGAVRIQDNFVMVSNRGHDSIALFEMDGEGMLTLLQIAPCGGKTPRDFNVFGDYAVTANQDSDNITVLKLNRDVKKLEMTDITASAIRPSCILGC